MVDMLDVNEVDDLYYGLFKSNVKGDDGGYTVFKSSGDGQGVVKRLPWKVVVPSMFRTCDPLYSLYVVVKGDDGKVQLREISCPDQDIYADRVIEVQRILEEKDGEEVGDLNISWLMMDDFILRSPQSSFLMLSNKGLSRIHYVSRMKQLSIDGLPEFKDLLAKTLKDGILHRHMEEKHVEDLFKQIERKVNQRETGFSVFDLLPTEFQQTQDIGVIPDSKIDDDDDFTDHRSDSIQVSTDLTMADGMFASVDTNPGIVSGAVANPATTYDSDYVFLKSQRNPSIVGTEFYDYITDTDGNILMDLYQIPFIYQVNTNNTYDLYINLPTTRTKYLNRIAGTLKDDLTSQVLKDDVRARLNFNNEMMPNNLDESTTRLRVYIDRKYISIGNVELVEISGNSIPLQIYRDSGANNDLYDSIALESRWDGEVVEINEPSKDINKVMLEFECYGTDSQSIHIQGKTLINRALDDKKYIFG